MERNYTVEELTEMLKVAKAAKKLEEKESEDARIASLIVEAEKELDLLRSKYPELVFTISSKKVSKGAPTTDKNYNECKEFTNPVVETFKNKLISENKISRQSIDKYCANLESYLNTVGETSYEEAKSYDKAHNLKGWLSSGYKKYLATK